MNVSYNLFCVYIYLKSLCGSHFPECLSWRVGRPLIGRSAVRSPAPPVHMSKWPRASYWTPNCSRRHSHRCMGVCEWVRLDPDDQEGTLHVSSKTTPQHNAATTVLHSWDDVIGMESLTLFPPQTVLIIVANTSILICPEHPPPNVFVLVLIYKLHSCPFMLVHARLPSWPWRFRALLI